MPVIITVYNSRGEIIDDTEFEVLTLTEVEWVLHNFKEQYPEGVRLVVDIAYPA